ncbi:thioredoxin-related transmembrane protein 4 isoform X1 [Anas platyrhynchos]|uniref:thioredoxin-related transmembrane protein 4 isoform X1 n=1 Tax=Anas platyrhynchos TaxID=8839 RepID=UPI0018D8A84E|nr:thioredoxin-related transmembrane protein 4 [Anas platyrhynchos]
MAAGGGAGRWLCAAAALLQAAALGPSAAFSSSSSSSSASVGSPGELRSRVRVLGGSNWSLVLQGQWMVEFYAPWCPACQQIELIWESFAKESERLDITVGKVDVTQEPGLSGRFFVTTLPTIYHANNGVFRRYRGSRTLEDLQGYVLEKKWQAVEPVAGWKSPSSIMMHGMAGLFHFSGWIRQIHSYLTGTLGIHVWMSYAIFILATLLIGLFLGLILVLISDCLCPSKSKYRTETSEEAITKENVENAALEEPEEAAELSADDAEETAEAKDLSDEEDAVNSSAGDSEEDLELGKESGEEETEDLSEQPLAASETESSVRQRKSQAADNGL